MRYLLLLFVLGCAATQSYTITPQEQTNECILSGNEQVNIIIHNDTNEMEIQKESK